METIIKQAKDFMERCIADEAYQEQREKERAEKGKRWREKHKSRALEMIEQQIYLNALDRTLRTLPKEPPKDMSDYVLKKLKRKRKTMLKRLEPFNDYERG